MGKLTMIFSLTDQMTSRVYFLLLSAVPDIKQKSMEEIQGMRFSERTEELSKLLESDGRKSARAVRSHLSKLTVLAASRNDIVHGWVRWDFRIKQPMAINVKKRHHGLASENITDLNGKFLSWLTRFDELVSAFLIDVLIPQKQEKPAVAKAE
jgi:hypothetical protein